MTSMSSPAGLPPQPADRASAGLLNFLRSARWKSSANANIASTVLFAAINIVVLKTVAGPADSAVVYFFANAQYVVQVLSIPLFYGIYIEHREELRTIPSSPLYLASLVLALVFPQAAFIPLLLLRMALLKFSRKTSSGPSLLVALIGAVALYEATGRVAQVYVASCVTTYLLFAFCDQDGLAVPRSWSMPWATFANVLRRTSLDYVLLLTPLGLNMIAYHWLDSTNYIHFQKCMTALAVSGPVTSYIERRVFDHHLVDGTSDASHTSILAGVGALTAFTVVGVLVIGYIVGVPPRLFFNLALCAGVATGFSMFLTRMRFQKGPTTLMRYAGLWALSIMALVGGAMVTVGVTVVSLLTVMAIFTTWMMATMWAPTRHA